MSPRVAAARTGMSSYELFHSARALERMAGDRGVRDPQLAKALRASHPWWRHAVGGQLSEPEHRVLSKASGAAGSFLVPSDFWPEVIAAARDQGSVAKVAKEILTNEGRTLLVPEVTAYGTGAWTSENASYAISDDTFGSLISLGAYKAETLSLVSEELLADSGVPLNEFLAEEFGGRLAMLEGSAFVSGDGSGKPQGALPAFPVVTAATGSSTTFTLTDLVEALHTVAPFYRAQGGAWIASDGILKALRKVVTSQGAPILIDPDAPGADVMLLGYPVYVDTNMPAPGANNKSIMFGGWKNAYAVRRVIGLSALRQMNELYALNGQVGFFLRERVDGRVLQAAAGVALQHSAT